ncbi:hypothetical protein F5144DRAFT_571643 [Chaetomium tenue]|uniref:Uncharacterized protein n=1 Tax=Chaetomium tenue TaxID=1854479 RepID=A0ACB7PAM5_9PEZI|nr:hypothetical protein F5144DRAFT_571643 [Chaetomium globosum]
MLEKRGSGAITIILFPFLFYFLSFFSSFLISIFLFLLFFALSPLRFIILIFVFFY